MSTNINDHVRFKVKALMEQLGVKKVKLGDILGKGKTESKQQKFLRAQRFLEGNASIKIESLMKLSSFFEKPITYFLGQMNFAYNLSASEKSNAKAPKDIEQIRESLERMGFSPEFIENQLTQLKAMDQYRKAHKKDAITDFRS
jgi:transcriptional regulator with XRE-family HTH domain